MNGKSDIDVDTGKIIHEELAADKMPSEISMVANSGTCLESGSFSLINETEFIWCAAEDWWSPSTEKGDIARRLERAYGRDSSTRVIIVATTYVCEGHPTCFKSVTEEVLATAKEATELIGFVWMTPKLKKCNLGERIDAAHWPNEGVSISLRLSMLVTLLVKKVKDFAKRQLEHVPFRTICENDSCSPFGSNYLLLYACKEYTKINIVIWRVGFCVC